MKTGALSEIFVAMVCLIMLAPIVAVLLMAFSETGNLAFSFDQLSLTWFHAFFDSSAFTGGFILSLWLGLVTAALATLLGGLCALAIARMSGRFAKLTETLMVLPILVPHILFGAALLLFFLNSSHKGTFVPLLLGHVVIALPYTVQTILSGISGTGHTLEEAAISLGATPFQAFRKVTLPLLRPSLLSAAIFAFVISFSDVNLAIILTGPQTTTLPAVIYSDVVNLGQPTVAAASTLQIALIVIFLLLFRKQLERRFAR